MRKKPVSTLTPQEAQDQLALNTLERKLMAARNAQALADKKLQAVIDELESLCIDDSLEEAVTRYVRQGELTRTGIMRELRAAYESRRD